MIELREPAISNPDDIEDLEAVDRGEDIPTLTAVVSRDRAESADTVPERVPDGATLGELETRLAAASVELADRLLHAAFQEMEAAIFEQVSNRLRAELPGLVARIVREQLESTA